MNKNSEVPEIELEANNWFCNENLTFDDFVRIIRIMELNGVDVSKITSAKMRSNYAYIFLHGVKGAKPVMLLEEKDSNVGLRGVEVFLPKAKSSESFERKHCRSLLLSLRDEIDEALSSIPEA